MIKGMTGFGSCDLTAAKMRAVLEIKSLNHRYLDVNYYLPIGFGSIEDKIRQIVNRYVQRGRITIVLKITEKPTQEIYFNQGAVKGYLRYALKLNREFGINGKLTVADLIRLPGVVEERETAVNAESLWPVIEKCLGKVLKDLFKMREREGKSLAADINQQLNRMLLQTKKIQSRAKAIVQAKKNKLTDEEFLSFQKSGDVNEELARLVHYIDELKSLLKSEMPVGKKLDFIAQEMQRETNTIGSKLQDKVVSSAVIALKTKIEKIREQSQNIE